MQSQDLEEIANALVADRKGILAVDETIRTLTKRFEMLKIRSTPESRRDYRELLFTTPGAAEFMEREFIRESDRICQLGYKDD